MTRSDIDVLTEQLGDRDRQLVIDVDTYRLMTTKQVQRLHFDHTHTSPIAAARACNRALARLRRLGVLRTLQRRIGGARAGSAGYVWYLGPTGDRLLQTLHPELGRTRRNYREPSRHFVQHTLAVTELATQAREAAHDGLLEVLELQPEPDSWQQSLTTHGTAATLKPDLRLIAASGMYEDHWFIEADLATEHLPVIVRQCLAYQTFRASGRYQAGHGLFPAVLWVTPTPARKMAVRAAVAATAALDPHLFTVCTADEFTATITGGRTEET